MLIVQTLPDILRMLSFTGIHYRNALLENYRQKTMTRGTNAVRSDVSNQPSELYENRRLAVLIASPSRG